MSALHAVSTRKANEIAVFELCSSASVGAAGDFGAAARVGTLAAGYADAFRTHGHSTVASSFDHILSSSELLANTKGASIDWRGM